MKRWSPQSAAAAGRSRRAAACGVGRRLGRWSTRREETTLTVFAASSLTRRFERARQASSRPTTTASR